MERLLGVFAVVLALTACGDTSSDSADDPADDRATGSGAPRVVTIVSGSAAGGTVGSSVVLDGPRALARFTRQLRSPALVHDVRSAVEEHAPASGRVLGVAVIAIGCDPPPGATVEITDGGFVVTPEKVVSPHPECFAPVTSVAVVDLPRAG